MTAADGSRLAQLDVDLWVDVDRIVAVRTYTDQLLRRRVELTLDNGAIFEVATGPEPGSGTPRTEEEREEELQAYLLNHLGDLLEGVDYGRDSS